MHTCMYFVILLIGAREDHSGEIEVGRETEVNVN